MTGIAVGVFLQIILVKFFSDPKRPGGRDLGDNGTAVHFGRVEICDEMFGDVFLLVGEIEDGRPVRRPNIVALAVAGGGIMDLEKEFQQFAVRQLFGIEDDLDAFCVGAVIAVSGIGDIATSIADGC